MFVCIQCVWQSVTLTLPSQRSETGRYTVLTFVCLCTQCHDVVDSLLSLKQQHCYDVHYVLPFPLLTRSIPLTPSQPLTFSPTPYPLRLTSCLPFSFFPSFPSSLNPFLLPPPFRGAPHVVQLAVRDLVFYMVWLLLAYQYLTVNSNNSKMVKAIKSHRAM